MVVTLDKMDLLREGRSLQEKCDSIEGDIDDMLEGEDYGTYRGISNLEDKDLDKLDNLIHDLQGCKKELKGFYEKHPNWWVW